MGRLQRHRPWGYPEALKEIQRLKRENAELTAREFDEHLDGTPMESCAYRRGDDHGAALAKMWRDRAENAEAETQGLRTVLEKLWK